MSDIVKILRVRAVESLVFDQDMEDAADEIERLRALVPAWQPISSAPKDQFILLYCTEDGTRWLAKWQGDCWHGVDDHGLTREAHTAGDPNYVTGWFINAWQPLPSPPEVSS